MAKAGKEGYSLDLEKDGEVFGSVAHVFKDLPQLAEGVQEIRAGLEKTGHTDVKLVRVDLDKLDAARRRIAEAGVDYVNAC